MDWSLLIAACSLLLSVINSIVIWRERQRNIFLSDVNVERFDTSDGLVDVRVDLTINVLSSDPLPVTQAAMSMDTEKWFLCSCHPPTADRIRRYSEADRSVYRKAERFFGGSIRFPTTLPPSSAQHICLWLTLPAEYKPLSILAEAYPTTLSYDGLSPEVSSRACTGRTSSPCLPEEPHYLYLRFYSGNSVLLATVPIDRRNTLPLLD